MSEVIAECRDYAELLAAFRKRLTELRATFETMDEISGLPSRYCSKVLGNFPTKSLGPISTGPIMGTLAVKILVVHDEEAFEKIKSRLVEYKNAGTSMLASPGSKKFGSFALRGKPEIARILRNVQVLRQSPERRQQIARNAARMRWGKPRRGRPKSPAMP